MSEHTSITLLVIQGPTAVGKTGIALELAGLFPVEIINADSMQVYRGMNIGTSKPDAGQQARVAHHLFSIAEPDEDFNAATYMQLGRAAITDIAARGRVPLIVGGTGLYIQALLYGLSDAPPADREYRTMLQRLEPNELHAQLRTVDPQSAARIHPHDTMRVVRALEVFMSTGTPLSVHHAAHHSRPSPYNSLRLCLERERTELYKRINRRVEHMIAEGFVDEVRALLERGVSAHTQPMQAIGYRHMLRYLEGACSLDQAIRSMQKDTRHLAKRQITWQKRIPDACRIRLPRDRSLIADCVKKALNKG